MDSALNSGARIAPTRHAFDGTDLEIAHDVQGNDLILRVNKGGVLVFRAKLREALQSRLVQFNSIAPDLGFTVGDTEEGLTRMMGAAGLEQEAPERVPGLLRRFLGLG
jgi:hypothetical protein